MRLSAPILAGLMPAAFLAADPAALANDFLPDESNIRMQKLVRQAGEMEWPFAAAEGTLVCMRSFAMKVVIFVPEPDEDIDETAAKEEYARNNYVMVSTDPLQLWLDVGKSHLFSSDFKIEDKIRRLAPFATMGKKLCDQPKWTNLGPSEL